MTEESVCAVLLRDAARETAAHVDAASVQMLTFPADTHPMVVQIFSEELSRRNISVSAEARSGLSLDLREMNFSTVRLDNSSYLRNASVSLGVVIGDRGAGSIRWSKEFRFAQRDTLDGVPAYQTKDLRESDRHSWLEAFAIPAITTAAAIIIVILLFTVRGSS
jgi:hypothetical protein